MEATERFAKRMKESKKELNELVEMFVEEEEHGQAQSSTSIPPVPKAVPDLPVVKMEVDASEADTHDVATATHN